MVDIPKLRVFSAVAGVLLGLGGMAALVVAVTVALAEVLGITAACFTVAALMLAGMCLCLYIFLRPSRSTAEEIDSVENMTAEALADLPFDTLKAIIEKRPLTVTALAMLAGYTLIRDPKMAQKHAERFLLSAMV